MTRPADYEELVAEFPRGDNAVIRVRIRTFDAKPFVDLRIFEHGEPTKRGLSLRVGELVDVAIALQKALSRIVRAYGGPSPKARRSA